MLDHSNEESGRQSDAFQSLLRITHLIYALHAFALLTALLGSAVVVWGFAASLPSIIAVLLNYFNRAAARGTWLESHFRWQIRTFWFAWLWILISILLFLTIIGVLAALVIIAITGFWVLYRIAWGWWMLFNRRALPMV